MKRSQGGKKVVNLSATSGRLRVFGLSCVLYFSYVCLTWNFDVVHLLLFGSFHRLLQFVFQFFEWILMTRVVVELWTDVNTCKI